MDIQIVKEGSINPAIGYNLTINLLKFMKENKQKLIDLELKTKTKKIYKI